MRLNFLIMLTHSIILLSSHLFISSQYCKNDRFQNSSLKLEKKNLETDFLINNIRLFYFFSFLRGIWRIKDKKFM